MAANTKDTEVAAKKIGLQLQSLLKIPPIKKEEEQKSAVVSPKEKVADKNEEKENRRNFSCDLPAVGPAFDPSVPRDRFGRPFQSLGRGRGRGRDFHTTPKRFGEMAQQPPQRDVHVPDNRDRDRDRDRGEREREPEAHPPGNHVVNPSLLNRGRGRQVMPMTAPGPTPPVKPGPAVGGGVTGFSDRFGQARKPLPFTSYEQPPRFTEDSGRVRVLDPVDPSLRQLARKPECPVDIKENIDEFHDGNFCMNAKYMAILKKHAVCYLVKKSPKFPRAKYYCMCCNYHMDNLYATINHIMQERHYSSEKMFNVERTAYYMPTDHSPEHMAYLTDLLIKTSKLYGINTTEKKQRLDIVRRINEALKESNLDCEATLFGSSLPGFGLRQSNVNININVGMEMLPVAIDANAEQPSFPKNPAANPAEFTEISSKLLAVIKKLSHVRENTVKEAFTPKCVSILFEEEVSRASCIVHYNNSSAVLAAQLFSEYDQLDERVKMLVTCFRYWAKLCDIDDPEKGFLPPHCYTIMVLHFLIREKKILPNLHLLPRVKSDRLFATAEEARKNWTGGSKGNESVGELWVDLLRYYSLEFSYRTHMVTISRDDPSIPKTEKQWNRRLCIEDPIIPKSNLSRIVTNNKICDYIIDRLKLAYCYFGIPRKVSGPLYNGIFSQSIADLTEMFPVVMEGSIPTSSETLQRMVRQIQKGGRSAESESDDSKKSVKLPEKEVRMTKMCWGKCVQNFVHFEDAKKVKDMLFKREYHYDFKQENFTDGSPPPLICKSCGLEGHLKGNCPDETIPPFGPVEYPSPLTLARLNKAVYSVCEREALDRHDVMVRTRIVDEVREILMPVFPSVCLTLFGSTFNGFGMHSSDVDICLTFNDIVVPPDQRGIKLVDVNNVLEKIVTALKASGKMTEILSIPSAKVPIVKFRHIGFKLEGDISLYNRLSIYNTELLRLYVDMDSRVMQLGLFLKKLVKLCDVGDASKGSLSSYSYILMLIHFLQNHSIPVLPVLQELQVPGSQSSVDYQCDNHHVKYSKDLKRIVQVWDGYGKNTESVSQLWLAFLSYYVEHFDTEKYVITISQSAPLTRASKSWFTDAIAIEDPFDKTHNLGLGLSRRMSVHIIRTLQTFRTFFHQSTDNVRNDGNFTDYYMNVRNSIPKPPIDRQCRLCNRIGHFARSCTYVNKPDGRLDEEDQVVFEDIRQEVNPLPNGPPKDINIEFSGITIEQGKESEKTSSRLGSPEKSYWGPFSKLSQNITATSGNRGVVANVPNGNSPSDPVPPKQIQFSQPQLNVKEPFKTTVDEAGLKSGKFVVEANGDNIGLAKSEEKPKKEVIFFGDIGSTNAEGEQIQAMLQKNQGVTFAFGSAQRPTDQPTFENMHAQEMYQNNVVGNVIGQPPPGFCPPGGIYMQNGPPANTMPFIPDQGQGPRPVLPSAPSQPYGMSMSPIAIPVHTPPPSAHHWHNQVGMPMQFQPVIPVGVVPFDSRQQQQQQMNGENAERASAPPMASGTAPPPGFAPLPTAANTPVQPQPSEMVRSYPASFSGVPQMGMYSVAPVGMGYQASSSYTSNQQVSTGGATEGMEPMMGYRPMNVGDASAPHAAVNYDGQMVASGQSPNPNMLQQQQQHMNNQMNHHQFHPQHPIPLNAGMPNGQMENGEEAINPNSYMKGTAAVGEMMYGAEYGAGNVPVTTYGHGLSLSQAHHGPVVSALQMQHSQHHPMQMQGGHHYHHQVRPFMPMANFAPGSPYGYPPFPVQQHEQPMPPHMLDQHQMMSVHGGDQQNQMAPQVPLDVKHAK